MDNDISVREKPPEIPQAKSQAAPGRFLPGRILARWWWLVALVMISIVGVGYKIPDWFGMRGPLYESTTLLEIRSLKGVVSPALVPTSPHAVTASPFMATQKEIMQAHQTLELAIDQKNLLSRLGGSRSEGLKRMEKSLTVRPRYGTDLMELIFRDEDPLIAQDAVTAIYESYVARRSAQEKQLREDGLSSLKLELKNTIDRVAELRLKVGELGEKVGGSTGESVRPMAEKELFIAERQKERTSLRLKKLMSSEDEEMMLLLHWQDDSSSPKFKEIYLRYEKAVEKLQIARTSGLGAGHPDLLRAEKDEVELKSQLVKRHLAQRHLLALELKAIEAKISKMDEILNPAEKNKGGHLKLMQGLDLAEKEYAAARSRLNTLQQEYNTEISKRPASVNHIVHEYPKRPTIPVTKGRDFFTFIFTMLALVLAVFAAVIVIYLAEAILPRRIST